VHRRLTQQRHLHSNNPPQLVTRHHLATQRELLGTVIGDKGQRSQRIRLGRALGAARDRRFGDLCLRAEWDKKSKQQSYWLVRESGTEPPSEPATA
jgi:hypothetical protein